MKYTISPDRKILTLTCTPEEQATLREMEQEDLFTLEAESEFLEELLANSELDRIDPCETGDLTDAPLLGILDSKTFPEDRRYLDRPDAIGWHHVGHWGEKDQWQPILERWGYMDYQAQSFLEELRDRGTVNFIAP